MYAYVGGSSRLRDRLVSFDSELVDKHKQTKRVRTPMMAMPNQLADNTLFSHLEDLCIPKIQMKVAPKCNNIGELWKT